ncbi:unnamed protein product [Nezara viridula]|uniref:Uncharacterized protein n=1 Tax=Nezara viridula TaxID=85310 RepID=A0A9P0H499_NEZVI|nr:unnamed protein product [Nezara viridula]
MWGKVVKVLDWVLRREGGVGRRSMVAVRGEMFTTLEKLGLLLAGIVVYKLGRGLASIGYYLLAPLVNLNVDFSQKGQWAVITGATDGIGKAFAFKLAEKGMDIVLISRTKTKLESVAQEIETKYKVNTKIIEAEFTEGFSVFQHIEKELLGLEIGVLINNVGISYPYPEYFLDLDKREKVFYDMIQCNIVTMLEMCQIVMPGMVERKKGVVINISSGTGEIPSPLLSVYSASKAFVIKFTKDLGTEYKKHGITIQCLVPGFVATKMTKIRKSTWMAPSPKEYVSKALETTGIRRHTAGYIPHILLLNSVKLLDRLSPRFAEWMIMRLNLNIRARALTKLPQTIG